MRRLILATQKLESTDPILAATVAKVAALAERVDELVVLCDSAEPGIVPANVRVREFGAATQVQRGARFVAALRRELTPRPLGVVAHMIPLYVIVAAPLVRPRRIPLRGCQPRDLIDQALALATYRGQPRVLSFELLDAACAAYFLVDEPATPFAP